MPFAIIQWLQLIEDEAEDPVTRSTNSQSDEVEPEFVSKVSSDTAANGAEIEIGTGPKSESVHTAAVPSARDQSLRVCFFTLVITWCFLCLVHICHITLFFGLETQI